MTAKNINRQAMDISSDLARIEIEAAEAGAAKNDAALDELEKLVAKQKQLEDKKGPRGLS